MKILGICGSTRKETVSGTYKLIKKVLDSSGSEYELISLRNKNIGGCTACLGCVQDNVCVLKDDMAAMRKSIIEADAYVIGAPNYYSGLNAITHAVLERFYQFRHQTGNLLWGKLAVALGVGGTTGNFCCDEIEKFMAYNFIETVAKVSGQGAACCFSCGYGESCAVGIPVMMYGEGVKITNDMIPDIEKQSQVMDAAAEAGTMLARRLAGHNRGKVTEHMQQMMIEKFKSST